MKRFVYNAYADNVMIERLETIKDTCRGKILHSNSHDLKPGTIVLYQDKDWNEINLNEDKVVDIIWKALVRAIIVEVEVEEK